MVGQWVQTPWELYRSGQTDNQVTMGTVQVRPDNQVTMGTVQVRPNRQPGHHGNCTGQAKQTTRSPWELYRSGQTDNQVTMATVQVRPNRQPGHHGNCTGQAKQTTRSFSTSLQYGSLVLGEDALHLILLCILTSDSYLGVCLLHYNRCCVILPL